MTSKKTRIAVFIGAAAALLFLPLFFFRLSSPSDSEAFHDFTEELFLSGISSSTLTLHYTLADPEAAGIHPETVNFGEYSVQAKDRSAAALENALSALSTFSPEDLSASDRLTFRILNVQLKNELELAKYPYYEEVLSPLLGVQAQLPVLLAEYAFYSRDDIVTYLKLLEQVDIYYQDLLNYEQEKAEAGLFMSDRTADTVIAQCRDFISESEEHVLLSSFEERMDQAGFLSQEDKTVFLSSNEAVLREHVFPAYELLIDGLTALKGSGRNEYGLFYFPDGTDYYEALMACTVGSSRTMEEITELVDRQMISDIRLMSEAVSRNPDLLEHLSRSVPEQSPEEILNLLWENIREDFPSVDSSCCTVKYVTPSLEKYLSPAFYLTPPIDRTGEHIIYINNASDYDSLSLFTTLAHEGYPGHLYQTMYENSLHLDPVRNLFYFGGYTEGWAVYAERYSYSYSGLDTDSAQLLSANSSLLLGLYARADIGIHWEGWKPEDLEEYFESFGITGKEGIEAVYDAIVQDPGNYLKYYLGAAEILAMKTEAEQILGDQFRILDFHKFILSTGPAPLCVLWDSLWSWTGAD